jgi:hypothetical protein
VERLETAEKQLAESNSALNREDWSSKPVIGHLDIFEVIIIYLL